MRLRGLGGQPGRTARPQPEGTGRRRSACGPDWTTHAWQISARQKNEGHHRHNRRNMAQPDTTTVVATSAAVPVASESAGVSQLQVLPLQSDRSRQAGNWRSPVPRSFSADFPPGSGVGLTTGPRSGSGAEGCHGCKYFIDGKMNYSVITDCSYP